MNGIGRWLVDKYGIVEGQFENGWLRNGWGRRIYSDGRYHIGWFKDGEAYGYGIGNAYTKGDGEHEGLYEFKGHGKSAFIADGNVGYSPDDFIAQRFDIEYYLI